MGRSLWLTLALVALGLWASLLPQVTYPSATSGEPSNHVLTAWPGWGVQQGLGPLRGTVGRFQIWAAGGQDRESRLLVFAWLLDAETGDVLRQTTIDVASAHIPVLRTLDFPSYAVPDGQRLLLQLQVAEHEEFPVSYRLAHPKPGYGNVQLNGVADAADGPLALAHQTTGSGLRAAILGERSERIRLALAALCSVVAVLTYPRVGRRLRKIAGSLAHRPMAWARRRAELRTELGDGNAAGRLGRLLSVPWYPWLFVTIPIVHFMASNQLYFAAAEMLVPLIVALFMVTISIVILWSFLKDWHRPAAVTAAICIVFFAYGHIQAAIGGMVDERFVFSGAAVLGGGAVIAAVRSTSLVKRSPQTANLAAAVLIVFPVVSLIVGTSRSLAQTSLSDSGPVTDLAAHLFPVGLPSVDGDRPDIYYIILDEYGRHDHLGGFDNTPFIGELELRGLYVATEATTNYNTTITSLASSLNLAYLDDLRDRPISTDRDRVKLLKNHALGEVLKDLGYTYVHLNSGHPYSDDSQIADFLVESTPAGVVMNKTAEVQETTEHAVAASDEPLLPGYFVRELVQTTALPTIAGNLFRLGDKAEYEPHDWWSPYRTLQMFDFLSKPIDVEGPIFVFAHIIKPHTPGTFDRHGNIIEYERHGNDAYISQLIYLNSLVLNMIDGILKDGADNSIIVIAGDHGRIESWGLGFSREGILAAFYVPNGGESALYPSISSVNHFRAILDFYFGLDLGLLEDRKMLAE